MRAYIDKFHYANEEGGASSNTTRVGVSILVSISSFGFKSVYMKDGSSPNLLSIGYSTGALRGHMTACQNNIYSKKIGNALKCTIVGGMVSALHHPGSYGQSELLFGNERATLWHMHVS